MPTRPFLAALAAFAIAALAPGSAAAQADTSVVVVTPPLTPPTLAVAEIRDDGHVTLADESFWEPDLEDRPSTVTWRPGDRVVVRRIPAPRGDYDFWLINATRADTAAARFAGQPRETAPPLNVNTDG